MGGEWITGRPFDGTSRRVARRVIVHRPVMGPVTAVCAPSSSTTTRSAVRALAGATAGARVRLLGISARRSTSFTRRAISPSDATALEWPSPTQSGCVRDRAASSPPSPIPWHRRMEARVVLGVSLFVGLSLGAVLTVTTRAVTSRSLERASDDLEAARAAFSRLVANRAEFAAAQTRLITALPVFRAHMTDVRLASDMATLDAMAEDYRRQLNAQFCIVTDRTAVDWKPRLARGEKTPPPCYRVSSALSGVRAAVYRASSCSSLFPSLPGSPRKRSAVHRGLHARRCGRQGARRAHAFRSESRAGDVHLRKQSARDSAWRATGAEPAHRLDIGQPDPSSRADRRRAVRDGTFPLFPDRASEGVGRLVLLQDWRPTQQFLDDSASPPPRRCRHVRAGRSRRRLFSRRMGRPLKDIAAAAGDIAAGNWARQVPLRGSAEATTMARRSTR